MAGTDFSHLTNDELIKGIQALNLPDYIRSKAYGVDVRETLAQMTEMTIQLGVNMGLSPDDALLWARKLQETVSQSEFDSWVATLLDGGPSIFMNTLNELKTTYPNGAAGVALVRETDPAKIYVWNGTAWEDFGDYQGIEIKDGSVTSDKLALGAVGPRETSFITPVAIPSKNLFDGKYEKYYLNGNGELIPTPNTDKIAFVEIESNTTYTVSRTGLSSAFRIGFTNKELFDPNMTGINVVFSEPESYETTVTSGSNENYMIIYFGGTGDPERVRVEELHYKIKDTILANVEDESITPKKTTFLTTSKNLFNEKYEKYYLNGRGELIPTPNTDKIAFVEIESNTTYTVSRTGLSSAFRIGFTNKELFDPNMTGINVVFSEPESYETTVTSGSNENYMIIYFGGAGDPGQVQVEEGVVATEYEAHYPGAKFSEVININVLTKNDIIYVKDFRKAGVSDTKVIQDAFDSAEGQIVEFESGKSYTIDEPLTANVQKVRGIKGNNSILMGAFNDDYVLRIIGSSTGSAGTSAQTSSTYAEMNSLFEGIKMTGLEDYVPDGIFVNTTMKPVFDKLNLYKLNNAITVGSMTRDLTFTGSHIYNNRANGILFNNSNLHQLIIANNHISYNLNAIKFVGGNLANILIEGNSLESNFNSFFSNEESIISFEAGTGSSMFEVVIINGNNIQGHRTNLNSLIDIDSHEGHRMYNLTFTGNHLGNTAFDSSSMRLRGVHGANITGNTITGSPGGNADYSIVIEGVNNKINISNNNLGKPVKWSDADITKMLISNNIVESGTMEEQSDGNIIVINNM